MPPPTQRSGRIALVLAALLVAGLMLWLLLQSGPQSTSSEPTNPNPVTGPGTARNGTALESEQDGAQRGHAPVQPASGSSSSVLLRGKISSATGAAIERDPSDVEDVDIARRPLFTAWARREGVTQVLQGNASPDGNYRIEGLSQGTWIVTTRALGHLTQRTSLTLTGDEGTATLDFELQPEPVVRVELVVRGAALVVRDQGVADALLNRLYGSAEILVSILPPSSQRPPYLADDQQPLHANTFGPRQVKGQDWVMTQRATLQEAGTVYVSLIVAGEVHETLTSSGQGEITSFSLDAAAFLARWASLSARVVDARNKSPLAGATVELSMPEGGPGIEEENGETMLVSRATSDAGGAVLMEALPAGAVRLRVSLSGFTTLERALTLPAGARSDLGELGLEVPLEIAGRVEGGPQGLVVEAALIRRPGGPIEPIVERATVLADGSFRFPSLSRGSYVLRLQRMSDWVANPLVIELDAASATGIVLLAQSGVPVSFELRSNDPEGAPILDVEVLDEHGLRVLASAPTSHPAALASGRYVAIVRQDGRERGRTRFEVGSQPSTVTIDVR